MPQTRPRLQRGCSKYAFATHKIKIPFNTIIFSITIAHSLFQFLKADSCTKQTHAASLNLYFSDKVLFL
jgi:hypothetical protein